MTSKRPAYNHYPTNETVGHTSSPGFSPAPETPISTTGYYSPLNPSHPLILPTIPQRRKSKPNTTSTNPNKRRKSSNVLKDQHHREDGFDHHHQQQHEAGASPAYQQNQADQQKEDVELENEQEEEDNRKELNDDDYTVRKREDLLNKDKLKLRAILASLLPLISCQLADPNLPYFTGFFSNILTRNRWIDTANTGTQVLRRPMSAK
jgi:hypothetical protein